MKPSQALRALLLILIFIQSVECRPVQVSPHFGSTSIDNSGEHFFKATQDSAGSVPLQHSNDYPQPEGFVENSRLTRDVLRSDQIGKRHSEKTSDKETSDEQHTSDRDRLHITAADADKKKNRNPTEGVRVEIIERPKELKVFVNKLPSSGKQSVTGKSGGKSKEGWQHVQREMLMKGKQGQDKSSSIEDLEPSEEYSEEVDDSDINGSGDDANRDFVNLHDVLHGEGFVSRDDAHARRARIKLEHEKKRPESSAGGLGILWSLVIVAFVLFVVAVVYLHRWCYHGKMREDVELEYVMVEDNRHEAANQNAMKEARISVGKKKSLENRKVLRKLSEDQGASNVGEELAIACSIIAPSIDTRRKNSEALHTRACVRAATSRRNSSFQEDLVKARCEFENAPARFAKLVSLAGDEKETEGGADQSADDTAVAVTLE